MKMILAFFLTSLLWGQVQAADKDSFVRGMSLNEEAPHYYDANWDYDNNKSTGEKTDAQKQVDKLYELGVRQINLHPIAKMYDPDGNSIVLKTKDGDLDAEEQRYLRFMSYVRSKGMKVGIRPILFVVKREKDDSGEWVDTKKNYYTEVESVDPATGETKKTRVHRWHGNIRPSDPDEWFRQLRNYHDQYISIAIDGGASEYTIGAELYSMTVGMEKWWPEHPHGFPGKWLQFQNYVNDQLNNGKPVGEREVRLMYDINLTNDSFTDESGEHVGGELARWRYRLEGSRQANYQDNEIWQNLRDFWLGLDAIGIDMYSSLTPDASKVPSDYDALVAQLTKGASQFVKILRSALKSITRKVGREQKVIIKEIGFKSVSNGFINPFSWDDGKGAPSAAHQAAAFEAIYKAWWESPQKWFGGIYWWEGYVDPKRSGPEDKGFSPVGKPETEAVLKKYFSAAD